MRKATGLLGLCCLTLMLGIAQQAPLINYATLYGEFDYDFYRGNTSIGLVQDGRAEGFSISVPSGFTTSVDTEDKVSGLASQRIVFSRNAGSAAEARFSMTMYFPSEDYPQVGEPVTIRLWVKASSWTNGTFIVQARPISAGATTVLLTTTTPPAEWTQFTFTYTTPPSNPAGIVVDIIVRANAGVASGDIRLDKLEVTGSKRWRERPPRSLKIIAPYYPWAEESQRDWVYYAREFDAIIANWDDIKALRTHRPNLLNVLYYNLVYSADDGDPTTWAPRDIFGYDYANQYHPEWFLLNVFGQRQQFGRYLFLMDIGNPQASAWAAQNLNRYMAYADPGVDVIHFDSFIDFFFNNFLLQRYPTRASRIAAMHKHLMNMRAATQAYNTRFIINAAAATYTRDQPHTYFMRMGLLDGLLMEEVFTRIFTLPPGYLPFSQWEGQLNTLVEYRPRLRVVYTGYAVGDPVEGRRQKIYALASFLLCADDNIYLYLDKHYYESPPYRQRSWRPDPDFDVPLGRPTGNYQVFFRSADYAGGLYYRPFENGFVLVNPTGNVRPQHSAPPYLFKDGAVFSWILDADYFELRSGRVYPAGTRIKLYPKEGLIFVRASGAMLRDQPPGRDKARQSPTELPSAKLPPAH
ncbi:MAG: putative glycoside hydrolase [Armatimonadota bacterium]|nr:putative glycoside hydrolase [Armatimonadota bacterium]